MDQIDAATFNNLFISRLDTHEGLEKAAQAGAGDEEHHRDEQMNHAADNSTALAAPKHPAD